jgi:putative PIN family toxin of toxin-antitoxin system
VRLVVDTNVVVSALLWHGPPHTLFEQAQEANLTFYTSQALLDELADVLARRKLAKAIAAVRATPASLLQHYHGFVRVVRPKLIARVVHADPTDDHVLACALTARADLIVSGDRHLLALQAHRNIAIVNPVEALRRILVR